MESKKNGLCYWWYFMFTYLSGCLLLEQGEQGMISSIIWLVLVHTGTINEQFTPWGIYLPVCLVEIVVYFKLLTSWGEK
jgi:hypothetical protein